MSVLTRLFFAVLFIFITTPLSAQHCLEKMSTPTKNLAGAFVNLGGGQYQLLDTLDERSWGETFRTFRDRHTRLKITAMNVGKHWSDECFDYLADITLSTEPIKPTRDFKKEPFRVVWLGLLDSPRAYIKAIRKAGMRIGRGEDYGTERILKDVPISSKQKQLALVFVTPGDLGFAGSALRSDVYAQAMALGLELCPAEVGFALRLAYKFQSNDGQLWIASEPVMARPYPSDDTKYPRMLGLYATSNGILWLVTGNSYFSEYINRNTKLVFVLPDSLIYGGR